MPIPVSARAILEIGTPAQLFSGTLGEQMLRYLALDGPQRRLAAITVSSAVVLPGWAAPTSYLDTEAIRDLAREMTSRGLL